MTAIEQNRIRSRARYKRVMADPVLHERCLWLKRGRKERTVIRGTGFYCRAKRYALKKGMSFGLSFDEYKAIFRTPCSYCGKDLSKQGPIGLDRVDSSRGYVVTNVVSCCRDCNVIKSNLLSFEEMKIAMQAVMQLRRSKLN